jgi:hypothetical protein
MHTLSALSLHALLSPLPLITPYPFPLITPYSSPHTLFHSSHYTLPLPCPDPAVECVDEGSGDVYFFNQVSGESVWERDEIPGI